MSLSPGYNLSLHRIQAGIVAGIYMVLCTLGALTHNHAAPKDVDTSWLTTHHSGAAVSFGHVAEPPAHCAYCEWQASSVSPALAVQKLTAPASQQFEPLPPSVNQADNSIPHRSSRAPPIA